MTNPSTCACHDDPQPTDIAKPRKRQWALVVCVFLVVATEFVYMQTLRFDFVNCDDQQSVYENPHITGGLTYEAIVWAFTAQHPESWCPLTPISHMVDCQLFGLNPLGHHLHNVLLHTISTILLFLILRAMTGRLWPSAFVAAVFAVHPLHVESVAWITERKDVLGGLFFMLALGAYVGYVRGHRSALWYAGMLLFFAVGLLAKPIVITFPFVLLLLDYWPLGRMTGDRWGSIGTDTSEASVKSEAQQESLPSQPTELNQRVTLGRLVLEKVPLFILVAISCGMTLVGIGSALETVSNRSFFWRIGNGMISYVSYIIQTFYPMDMTVMYPRRPLELPIGQVIGAGLILLVITRAVWVWRRKCPYFLVGWLWYLGTLFPMIGMVQFGIQAEADRFMYLPQIGLVIALTWGAVDLSRSWPCRRLIGAVAATLVLVPLMGTAWQQTTYWRNSESLWTHSLTIMPRSASAHLNLGNALFLQGRIDEGIEHFRQALEIQPKNPDILSNYGHALGVNGESDKAVELYQKALKLQPDNPNIHNNYGNILATSEQFKEAESQYREALRLNPDFMLPSFNLGVVLAKQGNYEESIKYYRKALEKKPEYVEALSKLAELLATCPDESLHKGNGSEAVEIALKANKLSGGRRPEVLNTLAAAYAEMGVFSDAIATADKALVIAKQRKNQTLIDDLETRLALYREGKPYRQSPPEPEAPSPPSESETTPPSESEAAPTEDD